MTKSEDILKVVTDHIAGKTIQYKFINPSPGYSNEWLDIERNTPCWNFSTIYYRTKPDVDETQTRFDPVRATERECLSHLIKEVAALRETQLDQSLLTQKYIEKLGQLYDSYNNHLKMYHCMLPEAGHPAFEPQTYPYGMGEIK